MGFLCKCGAVFDDGKKLAVHIQVENDPARHWLTAPCNCAELLPDMPGLVEAVRAAGAHLVGCEARRLDDTSVTVRQAQPSAAEYEHADSIYGVACLLRNEVDELIERTLDRHPTIELAIFAGQLGGALACLERIVSVGPPVRPRIARAEPRCNGRCSFSDAGLRADPQCPVHARSEDDDHYGEHHDEKGPTS